MQSLVRDYGLFILFLLVAMESAGIPLPGETALVAAGVLASQGDMSIVAVIAVAAVAAILGDNVGYWIGVRGGRKAVHRWGRYVFLTPERLARAEDFFARRGGRIVLAARFIDGLRQFNGVIAGLTSMPWRKFLLYNTLGAAIWVGWWTTVAYLLGTHLVELMEKVHPYRWWAISLAAVAVATYVTLHVRHIKRRRAGTAAAGPAVEESAS